MRLPEYYVANVDKDKDRYIIEEVIRALAEELFSHDLISMEKEYDIETQATILTFTIAAIEADKRPL